MKPLRERVYERVLQVIEEAETTDEASLYPEYADRPEDFAHEILGLRVLTEKQREILRSVRDNAETNVPAAHSVGKTLIAAVIVLWWVYAVGGIAFTTAPREKQVKDLLWREIRNLFDRNRWRLGGTRDMMQIKIGGDIVAWGFTASEHSEEGFGGRHHPKLLAIEDEASGISQIADDGVTSNLTYYSNRLLRIGNPLTDGTPFHHACSVESIEIPIWTHPNVSWAYTVGDDGIYRLKAEVRKKVTKEDGTVLGRHEWPQEFRDLAERVPGGPSIEWIEKRRSEPRRGPGTSYWKSRLDANFPEDSSAAILPRTWFDAARRKYDENPEYWDERAQGHIWINALDVGDGVEPHVIAWRRGPVIYGAREIATFGDRQDIARAEGVARQALAERPGEIVIDDIGVGSGVLSGLLEDGLPARGMKDAVYDSERYVSARADMFWFVREEIEGGRMVIAPLGVEVEETAKEEFAQIRRIPPTSRNRVRLERKEETMKRLGRSPNVADAIAMTMAGGAVVYFEVQEEGLTL